MGTPFTRATIFFGSTLSVVCGWVDGFSPAVIELVLEKSSRSEIRVIISFCIVFPFKKKMECAECIFSISV